jgi:hypothetical protein
MAIAQKYAMQMTWSLVASLGLAAASMLVGACGDSAGDGGGGGGGATTGGGGAVPIATLSLSGTVVDFVSGDPVSVSATLTVSGIEPAPSVTLTAASFTIDDVPPFSLVQTLAGAPPDYQSTYNVPIAVEDTDVSGAEVAVVSNQYLTDLATAFGVASGASAVLFAQASDATGPRAGVAASAFELPGADGPYFLDAALQPDPLATATSSSGWVVFYDVATGLAAISAAMGSGLTFDAAPVPVAAAAVSITSIRVVDGELVIPTNVSFSGDVVAIFTKRGCVNCHSGNAIGADLGDLSLNTGNKKVYSELTEELSPTYNIRRVDTNNPPASLLLTMPSLESPADPHPNATFTSAADPDYLTLLGWITEGALEN